MPLQSARSAGEVVDLLRGTVSSHWGQNH